MSLGITGKLVLAFVTLLLGAVLIGTIASNSLAVTDKKAIADEQQIFSPISVLGNLDNETQTFVITPGNDTSVADLKLIVLSNVLVTNSSGGETVPANNYTVTGGAIIAIDGVYVNFTVNVSANYTYWKVNESETFTVTNNPTDWKVADCPLASFAVKNASGGTDLTLTTDYVPTLSAGTFTLVDTSDTTALISLGSGGVNSSFVDYTYCGDDYINIGWGRTIINLLSGFFALAILGASVGLFYSVGKDTGIIG